MHNPTTTTKPQGQALKRYFAKRVIDQVRQLMEIWRLVNDEHWSQQRLLELKLANEKLFRYATRFEEHSHAQLAEKIDHLLDHRDLKSGSLSSTKLEKLSRYLQLLSQAALRKTDYQQESASVITPKKPIYIILNDRDTALKLARQLQFFGFRSAAFDSSAKFLDAMKRRYPAVIVADVDFTKPEYGFELVKDIQKNLESPIPTIFFSSERDDVQMRLSATRLGGEYFHIRTLEMSSIVEEIEAITNISPPEPYRVLIVEDSKSQSYCIENMLNTAGVITKAINNPLEIFEALSEFRAEIILMDMYMPGCNGMELATVIRQEKKYVSIPIVFLSAEDDLDIQLAAMSEGGDDFLTKPIKPNHLRSTIRTKAQRARALVSLMIRDSLTGLLNHTSILSVLEDRLEKARKSNLPLCFAMIDIDHFKQVNDTYGHFTGDKVIKSLALFLKQRLRKSDAIGRYGGEEFAVVLPNTRQEDCVQIFEDIRIRFSQFTHNVGNQELKCTFSCGIASLADDNQDLLMLQADEALYQAKRGGRNQIQVSDPGQTGRGTAVSE